MLEGQCRCGEVSYRLDPPHHFSPHAESPMVHLAGIPRFLTGEHLLEGKDWRLCSLCGTTVLYQGRALSSTLERSELVPEALHKVGRWGFSSLDSRRMLELIRRGMPIDALIDGETPLARTARRSLEGARMLLEHGAQASQAIPHFPGHGYDAVLWQRLLLQYGCKPQSLLYQVASRATVEAARVLLEAGVDVNLPDEKGWRPLYLSAGNSLAMMKFLLENGADPQLPNADGLHALHYCAHFGYPKRLHPLLQAGVSANLLDSEEESALLLACASGHFECARLLLEGGADVNLGADKFTPLMGASRHGSLALVDLLLKYGASPELRSERWETARDIAAKYTPDLFQRVSQGKDGLQFRWAQNAVGERCLKVRYRGKTTVWTDNHAAIVERLS